MVSQQLRGKCVAESLGTSPAELTQASRGSIPTCLTAKLSALEISFLANDLKYLRAIVFSDFPPNPSLAYV